MISAKKFLMLALVAVLLGSQTTIRMVWADDASADDWMEGCTLFITNAKSIDEAYAAADAVERSGGHIGVIAPNRVMLGWVPDGKVKSLLGRSHIEEIHKKPLTASQKNRVLAAAASGLDSSSKSAIDLFQQVVTGEYEAREAAARARAKSSGRAPRGRSGPDSFEAPPISYDDYMANLRANGITEKTLKDAGMVIERPASGQIARGYWNSDYMAGKVVFNAIFVESIGRVDGIGDPNKYTWSVSARDKTNAQIAASLLWWANRAGAEKYSVPLTFVHISRDRWRTKKICTRWEPILHSSKGDYLWIEEIMANFGFASGDKLTRTAAFNTAEKIYWKTNWAVTSFIGYNPTLAAKEFTDGKTAYAYVRGPYSQLLYVNGLDQFLGLKSYKQVNSHETGHLFGADDEYDSSGCTCGRVTNNILNGNCENCNSDSQNCMMKNDHEGALCGYTPGQIGWRGVHFLTVETTRQNDGTLKDFFSPGEKVKYRANFCLFGPRLGKSNHSVRARFRANFFAGGPGSSSSLAQNTPWLEQCCVFPGETNTLRCWTVEVNKTIPRGAAYGPATLDCQLEVDGMGKSAVSDTKIFYVAPGAQKTEATSAIDSDQEEELSIMPVSSP